MAKDEKDIKLTEQEIKLYAQIDLLLEKRKKWEQSNSKYAQERIKKSEKELKLLQQQLDTAEELAPARKKEAEIIEKKGVSAIKSFARISGDVKKNLGALNSQSNIYVNIQREIIKEEEVRAGLSDAEIEASEARAGFLRDINSDLLQQAKSTAKAEQDARGINEFEQRRLELQENSLGLSNEQLKLAKLLNDQQETLFKKEERLNAIKESQKDMFDALPESVQKAVGFAKNLGSALTNGALPLVLISALLVATLSSFTKLDEAAEDFRKETGLTNSQTKGIKSDVNEIVGDFANLGVEAKGVFDTVAALKSEFSDVVKFSKETTAALTVLNANFGVSAESAAKVQSQFELIGGLSAETAANVQMQVASMANLAGVAPSKVFEDIAENAEATSTFFKGDLTALTKNAVQARRMGTSLKEQVSLAEKLLDFESGIEEELVAATFVGGQFNLGRARALAMEGKLAEANEETLKQIQRSGDFRKQDYFTQQQLAKAAGMSVEEINKQLGVQEKLSKLSTEERKKAEDAISQGLDITDINEEQLAQKTEEFAKQKEIQGSLTNVKNTFDGLIASVGSTFLPIMQGLASVFEFISSSTAGLVGFVGTLATLFGVIYGIKLKTFILQKASAAKEAYAASKSIVGAIASIFGGQGKLPIIGAVIAAAMVGSLFAALSKGASFAGAGDVSSPADGKTRISTKEGGLFELSPNDDLVAAPGAASALANMGNAGTPTILTDGKSGGSNLAALSAPLNAMINEIKALRADLNSGKIAVYMDTAKVTSNVSKNVDQGTRNSYNLGSA